MSDVNASAALPRLIQAATRNEVGKPGGIARFIGGLDVKEMVDSYHDMVDLAPRRGDAGYQYFVPRVGYPTSGEIGNRDEEYLCMALANDQAVLALSEEQVDFLMYQFPLYTTGGPAGTRGIDLVGHSHQSGRIWVIEVKVMPKGGRGQTPLRGLYEGLIYAAIVEANHQAIAAELGSAQFLRTSATIRPGVVVAAPSNYWSKWKADGHTGDWWPMYAEVVGRISESLETPIEIIDLGDVWFSGVAGKPFYLTGEINPQNVRY